MADLSASVGGVRLETCIYNASGPRSGTSSALSKVTASAAGAVLSKSATLEKQNGNPQPRIWHHPADTASFNSEGLPNSGIDYYIDAETIEEAMQNSQKPYFVSLSGKTLSDNIEMLRRISKSPTKTKISAIELNLACPNVIGKPIIAYDVDQMNDILQAVGKLTKDLPPLGVKLPPFLDFQHFEAAAVVLNKHKSTVKYVASINTIGNALAIDSVSEAPYISSNYGFAGLSGPAVKYTALANVCKLREILHTDIDVVGVGGVRTGEDVFEMLLAGASAVQIGTTHWKEGPTCFDRIADELKALLQQKGYTSVADVRGNLQPWSREGAARSRQARKDVVSSESSTSESLSSEAFMYKMLSIFLALALAVALSVGDMLKQSQTDQEQ